MKSGAGEQVIFVLHQLSQKALSKKRFAFKRPKLEAGGGDAEEYVDVGNNDEDEVE